MTGKWTAVWMSGDFYCDHIWPETKLSFWRPQYKTREVSALMLTCKFAALENYGIVVQVLFYVFSLCLILSFYEIIVVCFLKEL
jgi:hypothetical protein